MTRREEKERAHHAYWNDLYRQNEPLIREAFSADFCEPGISESLEDAYHDLAGDQQAAFVSELIGFLVRAFDHLGGLSTDPGLAARARNVRLYYDLLNHHIERLAPMAAEHRADLEAIKRDLLNGGEARS